MKNHKSLSPSKKTQTTFNNNLIFFSIMIALFTVVLVEIVYLIFFEVNGFGVESIYFVYIVPFLILFDLPLIHVSFRRYYKSFALVEQSLAKVADGDFSTRITTKTNGAFEQCVSNFNKMAQELENNKMLKEDFINNFSHEFKTPVASIKGFADLILEEELPKDEERKYLKIISEEAERLKHLSETIMLFTDISSDTIMRDKTVFSLDEQIKHCVVMLDKLLTEKNIEISANLESVKILSNSEILKEVWLNLLTNAIKYSHNGGKIELTLNLIGENAVFQISDHGIGMTETEKNKIFNEYYQADTSRKTEGFGLGLSIVKKIVNLANGSIIVTSIKNEGSIFTVTIPKGYNELKK